MSSVNRRLSVNERVVLTSFRVDTVKHIEIKKDICDHCKEKYCIYVCPAGLFKLDEKGRIEHTYEGCLECGACRVVCQNKGIKWSYPRGGFGVYYKYG